MRCAFGVCVCARVRARLCVHACVRACMRVHVCVCIVFVCMCIHVCVVVCGRAFAQASLDKALGMHPLPPRTPRRATVAYIHTHTLTHTEKENPASARKVRGEVRREEGGEAWFDGVGGWDTTRDPISGQPIGTIALCQAITNGKGKAGHAVDTVVHVQPKYDLSRESRNLRHASCSSSCLSSASSSDTDHQEDTNSQQDDINSPTIFAQSNDHPARVSVGSSISLRATAKLDAKRSEVDAKRPVPATSHRVGQGDRPHVATAASQGSAAAAVAASQESAAAVGQGVRATVPRLALPREERRGAGVSLSARTMIHTAYPTGRPRGVSARRDVFAQGVGGVGGAVTCRLRPDGLRPDRPPATAPVLSNGGGGIGVRGSRGGGDSTSSAQHQHTEKQTSTGTHTQTHDARTTRDASVHNVERDGSDAELLQQLQLLQHMQTTQLPMGVKGGGGARKKVTPTGASSAGRVCVRLCVCVCVSLCVSVRVYACMQVRVCVGAGMNVWRACRLTCVRTCACGWSVRVELFSESDILEDILLGVFCISVSWLTSGCI